jgi:3-keto steroid reductase
LLKEFTAKHATQTIALVITTRSSAKSMTTISRLMRYMVQNQIATDRVILEHVELDLLLLSTVASVSSQLRAIGVTRIDALILNAGAVGKLNIDFLTGVLDIMFHPVMAVTFPTWMTTELGVVCFPIGQEQEKLKDHDLTLSELFMANVFGHYVLSHLLSGLLHAGYPGGVTASGRRRRSGGRVIWSSSLEAETAAQDFDLHDIQGLHSKRPYQVSKRLIDLLALTPPPATFLPPPARNAGAKPTTHVVHPGITSTNIGGGIWWHMIGMYIAFWLARICGSLWHIPTTYNAAASAVYIATVDSTELESAEDGQQRKWGSSQKFNQPERAIWTGVTGRDKVSSDTTVIGSVDSSQFQKDGKECWRQMEELRITWMKRAKI